ncbi:dTDP-4-dehydrorhamnose reductase [Pseudalkalibacillus sp. JSM 102089]|uniref:dTDP-4-dehydrorhamnose reductase n=1 Tax=Pseudalkalibacillus sp. JSM 102089 TaxID=3229856 RepID=UPI00352313CF
MSEIVLVTGSSGQLGSDVVSILSKENYKVFGFSRSELDITSIDNVEQIFNDINPDIVIHCAAYTNVDLAEENSDDAFRVNAIGTRNLAAASEEAGAKLVYISTDYVFNGEGNLPYTEFDTTSPLGIYGRSKLAGEKHVETLCNRFFILRTSWVYGANGKNFVKTMLKLAEDKSSIDVVDDQQGCPTYTMDLVKCISLLIKTKKYGTYHVSNSGSCSWYEFAKAIFTKAGININVNPVTTENFPRPAERPKYSVFGHLNLRLNEFPEMRNWQSALDEFLKQESEVTQ